MSEDKKVPKLRFKDENGESFPAWNEVILKDIFKSSKGKGLSKDKIDDTGNFKCILYGELYITYDEIIKSVVSRTDYNEGVLSQRGDILIPSSTTTKGVDLVNASVILEDDVRLGGDITILRKKNNKINSKFFAYYLTHGKTKEIARLTQGTTIIHLYWDHFKDITVSIPCIKEQNKIVKFLSKIDNEIFLFNEKLNILKNFKKFLLQNLFPKNGELAPKLRFEEFVGEWNLSKLGDLATIKGRIGFRGYNKSDLVGENEGALTIGGKHISSNNKLDLKDPEYLSWEKYEESPEIKVYENDVLLVSTASVGKVAFIENLNKPATINPQLVVLKNIKINNKYLYYYLCTDKFQKNLFKVTSKTVIPTVSQNELKKLPIIYPKFKEQEKIINILSFIDKKIEMIENIIEKTEEFKKGLLQQMFV